MASAQTRLDIDDEVASYDYQVTCQRCDLVDVE